MTAARPPSFEPRRRQELLDELMERARAWLPDWRQRDDHPDFATAILAIAARLEYEVTQRLDKVPTKAFRGFLSWLGIRGKPGRAARLPVVFKMTPGSPPVLAEPPVQLQASGGGAPVTFETEAPLQIIPGQPVGLVAADPANDKYCLPSPGLFRLDPPAVAPTEWHLKSLDDSRTHLQLEPALGLEPEMVLSEATSRQLYRVVAAQGGIVTIDPPLTAGLTADSFLEVDTFSAFGDTQRDRQEHALYIGSDGALNIATPAFIEVTGGALIPADATWSYWGKSSPTTPPEWLSLERKVEQGRLFLFKAKPGAIEPTKVDVYSSRWIRANRSAGGFAQSSKSSGFQFQINCLPPKLQSQLTAVKPQIELEGFASTAPLVLDAPFYPLGHEPRLFDAFYLGCKEAFSKPAHVTLNFAIDASFSSAPAAIAFQNKEHLVVGVGRDRKLHRLHQRQVPSSGGKSVPDVAFLSSEQPLGADGRPIGLRTGVRPGAASDKGGIGYVSVAAGSEVWLWRQPTADGAGTWTSLGTPDPSSAVAPLETVVVRADANQMTVYALNKTRLYQRPALGNDKWQAVDVLDDNGQQVAIARIAPVVGVDAGPGELSDKNGMVCISTAGDFFIRGDKNLWRKIDVPPLAPDVYPLVAVKKDKGVDHVLCYARLHETHPLPQVIAFDADDPKSANTANANLVGHAFSPKSQTSAVVFVASDAHGIARPVVWDAFHNKPPVVDGKPIAATLAEAPVVLGSYYLFPGDKGNVSGATIKKSTFQTWTQFEPPARPRNPDLSWEYWNGTGWWQISTIDDATGNLVNNGLVTFNVPPDLQATEVAGRKNHWIRARLVGGDYGQETVKVVDTPGTGGTVTHQVIRSTDSIHPPYVISLDVSYQVCHPVDPDFVLTRDSGAIQNQTTANHTDGAIVEYFVPLAETLARLASPEQSSAAASAGSGAQPATAACVDCATGVPWSPPPNGAPDTPAASAAGRALYLGFNVELKGSISILFLLEEATYEDAYPLRVDAVTGIGFKPLLVRDGTRGLNESGIVTLDLAESPPPKELFGVSPPPYWLRVRPRVDSANWQPRIRGIYLNAASAIAAETQSLEALGSSDGSPNQRVTLARPPVLADSQKLRIREPLGDEDIKALLRDDPDSVRDKLGPWPGPWVLWREVGDPADYGVGERVYALDDDSGEIKFGDGLHGMIPPIGRNGIVAERYQRGGGTAANAVAAWSQLRLITPLQGVDSVVAPDGAAGGADQQDAATTIRFAPNNLSIRDRALASRDFELLALESSPDIAQVRALTTRLGLRLIVVMRGRDPRPSRATRRELRRYLAQRSAPRLSVADALQIVGPEPVPTRFALGLTVTTLEDSGPVAKEVRARLQALLDPAVGGLDGSGWSLAEVPSNADIAAALSGIKHLDGIDSIALRAVNPDGTLGDIPERLRPPQLLSLAPDGVSIEFAVSATEVVA